jgi:hypothetical protein
LSIGRGSTAGVAQPGSLLLAESTLAALRIQTGAPAARPAARSRARRAALASCAAASS